MVFEALVVELLNKFLNQYVENLDTSQLKIGIWGGDVVLNDLKIKTTLFDDLNLPVRVKFGKLGRFAMKIPWKNLYSSQVLVNIEELLVVIIPNNEFKYDPVKEEKWANDRKQAKLKAIEEARKKELQPETSKQDDGFIEKLLTQIIKNIQIVIGNIHIRYEDRTTIPNSPFSIGVTLSNLSAQTTATDPSGHFTKMLKENENFICKIVNLEGLAIYWNSFSKLYSNLSDKELIKSLLDTIPKPGHKLQNTYLFGPLTSVAFLRLNPKPEIDGTDFKVPKVFVQIILREIDLAITHNQFCDFMAVVEDSRRLYAANKYRKYRPVGIKVSGHAKEWWDFAYKCVAEDIIRRKAGWNWEHIKTHRRLRRRYYELFKQKLTIKKMSVGTKEEFDQLEKKLDLFNLILIREQVLMEVERDKENVKNVEGRRGSWFSGWFGRKESTDSYEESEIVKKIESVMTKKEKEKLYKAIGYEESASPTNYPPTFVELEFWFNLEEINMTIYDDTSHQLVPILKMSVKDVRTEFGQRSSANALRFVAIIGQFRVIGKADKHGRHPELVTSSCKTSESLIELLYETKPLNASCDQRIYVNARPLRVIYHAKTINLVREVFTTEAKDMEKLVAATSASLPTFQKITAFGLQYAIEKRTVLEVKVNVDSSYIIIPYEGEYNPEKDMLVIMLGSVTVRTEENQKDVSIRKLYLEGTTDEEIFSTVVSASYTKFKFELTGVQILFQLSGEDWVATSKMKGPSSMRFLESTTMVVTIKKSLVSDDARIPKIIIEGTLPNITFNLSEKRFVSLVALGCSIPTKTEKAMLLSNKKRMSSWSMQSIGNLGNTLVHLQKDLSLVRPVVEYTQGIDLIGQFEIMEMIVNVSKSKYVASKDKKQKLVHDENFLQLQITRMGVDIISKTFETSYLLKLGGINFDQYDDKTVVHVVSTKSLEKQQHLLTVEYVNLDTKIPDFFTKRQAVVNKLTLDTKTLNVLLNKEALLAQLRFATHIQTRVEEVKKEMQVDRMANAGKMKDEDAEISGKDEKKIITKGKRFRKKLQKEVVDLFLVVALEDINVVVDYETTKLCKFSLKGASVNIATRKSCTIVDFTLKEIFLLDLNPESKHKKIMASLEDHAVSSKVAVYNKDYFGNENTVDVTIDAQVCRIQLTFVNLFFSKAFEFLNAFQSQIQSLKEGASVAAQRAKENLINAYQNQSQVCLNVQITAPILIIPRRSTSLETLILDMGVLTLKNTINELDYVPSEVKITRRPLIDTMKLNLQQLKIIRCVMSDYSVIVNEKTFVVPVTLEITLKRNLSAGWFRVIPALEIFARLGAIHVKLTHEDLCIIVGIMRENVNEGGNKTFKSSVREKPERKVKEKETKHPQNREMKQQEETSNYTIVKFAFFMESIRFDATVEKSDEAEGLATFIMESISLKGRMFSDYSIHTSIMLISCLLEDTRPGNPGRLTTLMERTADAFSSESLAEENIVHSMVQIIYTRRELDTFVDIRVYKFTLILSMDFLQKLGEFFTLDEVQSSAKVEVGSKHQHRAEENLVTEQRPTFTVNIRLEKPDIIIVENMDSINTDALIFHAEMITKLRFAGSRQVINATLSDIELYSCCFNPSKRPYTLSQVIKPFTISVAGSTPEGTGLHVDICLTEISISIDPSTIDLLCKCYEALLKDPLSDAHTFAEVNHSNLWEVKNFDADDYSFLKPEEGIDALSEMSSSTLSLVGAEGNGEICLLAIPLITLVIEGRRAKRKQHLLLLEMGFEMQCCNWSSKMSMDSSLTLRMQYYNKTLSAWEPIIEPVEANSEKGEVSYTPWKLSCMVLCSDEEGEIEGVQPPKIQITLCCADMLQFTLTKTCLDVLKTTLDMYTSAVKKHFVKAQLETAPFIIINKTGLVAELLLLESQFQVCKSFDESYETVKLDSDSEVELQMAQDESSRLQIIRTSSKADVKLSVKFPVRSEEVFQLPLGMSSKRYYPFPANGESNKGEVWGLVSDVSTENNTTTVILKSIVRVQNDFNEPISIHVLSKNETETNFVGTAEGNSSFPLPFHAIYDSTKMLFFSVNGYTLSTEPFAWDQIKNELTSSALLQCNSKTPENNDPFFIQVVGEAENIYYADTKRKTMASMCFIIYLQPTFKIFNSLPVSLNVCFQGVARERVLRPGSTLQITNAEPGLSTLTLRISDYLEKEWSCKEKIIENPPEFFIWKFTSYNGLQPEDLNLGVRVTYKKKTAIYAIYCPYFMVNKTEHLLAYKFEGNSPAFYHPGDYKQPIMFSPSSKKFFSKKSAYLQLEQSDWSDKFPIDVAGSGGTIICENPDQNITYTISVTITLTQNSLTKIVTFIPYYIFVNSAFFNIEYNECSLDECWLEIPTKSCVPFWPKSHAKEKLIQVRPKGSTETSPPFAYSSTDTVLLKLNHKFGGINVNIQATNSGTYIIFQSYEKGQAPALILNYSDKSIQLSEKGTDKTIVLQPMQQVLHTWEAPTKKRELVVRNSKQSTDVLILDQETEGLIYTDKKEAVRYVSFLDGAQRMLLFTDQAEVSRSITSSKLPTSGIEVICKVQGVGLSVVNDLTRVEIFYFSFVSSNVNWEEKKSGKTRYKKINVEKATLLEAAYQKYLIDSETQQNLSPIVNLEGNLSVNFEKMEILSPHHRKLNRVYESGLWLAYRMLDDQVMLHVKVNRIQIDNQLLDSIFPIILTPVPPPKTVAAELKGPKPFLELSILKHREEKNGITQYKYFKILVQEFHVKVDIGFLQHIYEFLVATETTDEEEREKFRKELELTQRGLISLVEIGSSSGRKNFYELLHFSPLKIHFSFSLAGNMESTSLPPAFSVMLQSIGVTLTDVNDVTFRLSYFERRSAFLTDSQLMNEVTSHYYGQMIRQAYVLLLGLDVIGNPYGLIVGIGEGVEAFFYEPFQGIVQGPSDFAEGVAIGCKRFFKGAVGSTAGTLEKLTGTLGKGLAVLSLDKEYQMQRMENAQHDETIQASMARGGRGLFMGVFEGVTGVVRKPIEGAKEEGVGGFFKGVGKGMMGLVTRPVTGVVDFASTSLNAVKRATVGIYGNTRVRPPRFFRDECLIQPYNSYDAVGNLLFYSLCKRRYCTTDKYEYHFELRNKEFVILTNKRIILAEYSETFGSWQEHMAITWRSMPEGPRYHTKGVGLTLPIKSKMKVKSLPSSNAKILLINDVQARNRIYKKMVELYNLEQEHTEFT